MTTRTWRSAGSGAEHPHAWRAVFLDQLAELPCVDQAAKAAGVSRQTAYRHRVEDRAFRADWIEALGASVAQLEAKTLEQALHGAERRVYEPSGDAFEEDGSPKMRLVLVERRFNPQLAGRLLQAHMPETYDPATAQAAREARDASDPSAVYRSLLAGIEDSIPESPDDGGADN